MTTKEKKIACRYRKSCYKTGQLPQLDFYSAKLESAVAGGKLVEEDDEDVAERSDETLIDADEISDLEVKLLCKYRPSCYSEIGFDMSEANEKKSASLLSGRGGHAAAPGQKIKKRRTLKEVAQIALRKVEEQEKHSAQREVPKSVIVEKKLSEIEEKLKKKIACRYRKSCYTSGIVPDVEVPGLGFFSGLGASASVKIFGKKEERKEFDEMEDDERKVYCKYRRSCYSTGLLPEIKIEDRFQYDHIIEMDEVPMQVRCKYRKSCYDTGVVPEPMETTEKREREAAEKMLKKKTMPMTLDHLRLMCKYRKSCYVEKAGELEDDDEEKDVVSKNEESPEVPRPVKLEPEPVRKSKKTAKEAPERKEQTQKEKQLMSKKAAKKEAEVRKEEPKKTKPPKKTPPPEEQIAEEVVVQTVKKAMRGKKATHEEKEEEPARKQKKVQKKAEPESGEEEDERKSSCRYRKSCYESGVLPDAETEYTLLGGVQGFFSELYARAMDEGSDDEDDDRLVNSERWMEKTLEERKVDCRYRKSCYESGILPELERQTFDNVIESIRESRGTIQQRCKYRKSCYANEAENEEPVKESPKTKPKPKKVEPVIRREETTKESATPCKGKHCAKHHQKMQEQKKVKEEDNDSEEEEEEKVKPKTRKPRKEVDDDEENMKEIPRPAVDRRNVSTSEKLQCKYRPSCYGSGQFIVITPGGKRVQLPQGHKCKSRSSAYYLSCRQLLGLPPKEKAPIGPSGRKLCRKKKVTDAY